MKLMFIFSGEHPELPKAELEAVLEGESISYKKILENKAQRILVVDTDNDDSTFIRRLSFTKKVGEFISLSDDINGTAEMIYDRIRNAKDFAIRCKSHRIEEGIGHILTKKGLKVNLKNPEKEVICINVNGRIISAINIPIEKGFNERLPQKRPYFHPTSLHPKIARLLVNLSRVKKGDTILDPFCGTCGILIEAGLMGINVNGYDIDDRMVEGCRRNLEFFGICGKIERRDALNINNKINEDRINKIKFDGIVTDLPYGRSSYLTEKNLDIFYRNFIRMAEKLLNKGSYLVFVVPKDIEIISDLFEIKDKFLLYVHKSLTRRIYVLKRKF